MNKQSKPDGILAPALPMPKARPLCTDCGLSRMKMAGECGRACQFIQPDFPALETQVHGRHRLGGEEAFFGPHLGMHKARLKEPAPGAQWTGLTTRLAQKLLETGAVDAVLTVGPDPEDRWRPQPIIVTDPAQMKHARGMRMGYAPLLALLEPAMAAGYRKIAVIGIPCQIHALRSIEAKLGFERLYVIGTPCSDNTTTENFHHFLSLLSDKPETITYLEFCADYHVELRFSTGAVRRIPFLKLPLADLPKDFFPLTCRTCVDYTNVLADITVGYMAGQGEQWLIIRNKRGQHLLDQIADEVEISALSTAGNRAGAVRGFLTNSARAAGGLPLRRMPSFMRGLVGWLMPRIGPCGLEFARARVEMKAIETILHLRQSRPDKLRSMVPGHVWDLVARYGLTPRDEEKRK